jgi:hypothetical protein
MKFLLSLIVAMTLTLAWQSSAFADDHKGEKAMEQTKEKAMEQTKEKGAEGKKKGKEEPDCE